MTLGFLYQICLFLQANIMSFVAELLNWFEVRRPEFVQPLEPLDLEGIITRKCGWVWDTLLMHLWLHCHK